MLRCAPLIGPGRATIRVVSCREEPDLNSIETPCVLLDYAKVMANITWAQKTAGANKVALRPHIKTHKSLHIARLQVEARAVGITA